MTEIQNDSITELTKNFRYTCWLLKGTPRNKIKSDEEFNW